MAANTETMEVINAIHELELEMAQQRGKIKEAKAEYKADLADIDEAQEYADALATAKIAKAKLDRAILIDAALNSQKVNISEMGIKLNDLKEIMSHHLVRYFEKSGRRIIKISNVEEMAREIVVTAKLGRETPDEPETEPMEFDR